MNICPPGRIFIRDIRDLEPINSLKMVRKMVSPFVSLIITMHTYIVYTSTYQYWQSMNKERELNIPALVTLLNN